MKWRFSALVACLVLADTACGLDAESQRLTDRYLSILSANPMHQTAFDRLWKIHAEAGETEALLTACREEGAKKPVLYARVLQRAGQETEAKKVLGEATESGNVSAAEMLAAILEQEGELRSAADVIERAIAAHESQGLLVRLGELLQRAGEPGRSREAWERAVALAPGDLALRKRLAAASAQAGDWEAAVSHLRVIAESGSPAERFAAWGEISLRFEEAGKLNDAIAAQEALLALMGPEHWQLESARGRLLNLYEENHSLDSLEQKWREEAEARPRDPLPALRMAEFYEFQGDGTRQRDWLAKAATLLPKDIRLACQIAALDLSMGHPQAAADHYDKALAARPDDGDIVFLRAEASALLGQEADAEKRIEDYVAAHNDDVAETRAKDFYKRMRLSAPLERKLSAAFLAHPDDEPAVTELARFYLEQRRDAEAAACLSRFDGSRLDPRDSAAVAFRFSELLKGSGAGEEEQRWARTAFQKDPSKPEYALWLADLLQAEGQLDAAVEILRAACEPSRSELPREDLDRRLFLALHSKERATPNEHDKSVGPDIKEMIASLHKQAQSADNEAVWLRLARWLRWANSKPSPASALRRGLEAFPHSAALQEALAIQLADSGDFAAANQAFKRLAELAPGRRAEIQRRIGQIELDRGNYEDGLRIFQSLAHESKDWQPIADLALAQQMGGNWFDAFKTWQQAYEIASPSGRRTLRAPILNAATRLQLYVRGLDFLEEACAAEGDAAVQEDLLNEAAAYAVEHGVAAEWRSRIERRSRTLGSPWREGLISLLTAEGRVQEARQALKASVKDGQGSVEAIERLVKSAEDAADWDEAARLARRLVALTGTQNPSPSMRYADFLERAGKPDDAETVWQALAARHARNPQVLSAAGDFFERAGRYDRAEEAYRAAVRYRGCAPQVYLRLGRFALDRGDRSQALADFEALLSETRPKTESFEDCLPLPDRILLAPAQRARPGAPPAAQWKLVSETDNQGCRLLAIREAGQLLAHSPQKQEWVKQFSEPIERIWSKHYSGDKAGCFLEIEQLASMEGAGAAIEQGFAALAMEAEEDSLLGRWASDPEKRQSRWESVLSVLPRMLEANWRPSPEFLARLFSQAPALPRWRASEFLAQRSFLRTACALGETVPDALPASQACSAWIELARWWIAQCEPEEAIARLDRAIDCAPSSLSFSEPLFAALRARWLLTPESERAAFEEEVSARLGASKHRRCEKAAAALIASLRGDDSLASERVAEVVRDLGTSDDESWVEFVQQGGNQLEEWNLHRLARDLYRYDLARDSVLLSMRGENFHDSTTELLILNQLGSAQGNRIPYLLNEWLARGPSDRKLLDAVIRLQHAGRMEAAAAVYQSLCERNPRNEGVCAGILNLARVGLMRKHGAAFLERLLADEFSGLGRAMIQTAAVRLASILDEEGEYGRSLTLLNRLGRDGALNKALLSQHVQALCKSGRHREALAELERNPFLAASSEFTLPLAELYAAFGREPEAYALLEREARSGSGNRRAAAVKLRELAIQAGDQSRAAAAQAFLGPAPEKSSSQGKKTPANEDDWRKALGETDNPAAAPEERFRARRSFLVLQENLPPNLRAEELVRLKRITLRRPSLIPEYYVLRKELAEKFGSATDLLTELLTEWDAGRGSYYAAEIIIQILLDQERYEDLRRILNDYLADEHFNEQAWDRIGRRLLLEKQYDLAVRVLSQLRVRAPGDAARALLLAEALSMNGKHDAAEEIVSPIKRIAHFDTQKHIDLSEFCLNIDRPADAKLHLLAAPVDVRSGAAWMHAMERFLASRDFAEARECILHAMKTPQAVSTRALADYYSQSGQLSGLDPRANEFALPPRQFRDLQIELAKRLILENNIDRAWSWIESIASLLDDAQGRKLLQSVEYTDWNRAGLLWDTAEDSLWEARCETAQFFVRRAQASESSANALKDLARAHETHPGSFSIAQAYVARLLHNDDPAAARKVLRDVIDAYAEPADRRAARQTLASLQAAPSLPKGN